MKLVKALGISLLLLVALLLVWWFSQEPITRFRARDFQTHLHRGMTCFEVAALAKQTGGEDMDQPSGTRNTCRGYMNVAFGYSVVPCIGHWMDYYFRFDRKGRLYFWWTEEHDSAC